jgi:hypothetical protein
MAERRRWERGRYYVCFIGCVAQGLEALIVDVTILNLTSWHRAALVLGILINIIGIIGAREPACCLPTASIQVVVMRKTRRLMIPTYSQSIQVFIIQNPLQKQRDIPIRYLLQRTANIGQAHDGAKEATLGTV